MTDRPDLLSSPHVPVMLAIAFILANIFIFPLPHSIALRNLFGALALILIGYLYFRLTPKPTLSRDLRAALLIFAALSIWIAFQALAISSDTAYALKEFRQWLISSLYLLMGIGLSILVREDSPRDADAAVRRLVTLIMAVLACQILFTVVDSLVVYFQTGQMPFMHARLTIGWSKASSGGRTGITYISSLLLPILIADALGRLLFRKRLLAISMPLLGLLFAADLFCLYLMKTRNGIIDALILFAAATLIYAAFSTLHRKRILQVLMLTFAMLSTAGYFAVRYDSRWDAFMQTIPIALQTKIDKSWMQAGDYPTLSDGRQIDASAYARIAMLREGAELIMEHPLGWGYGRQAFNHAIKAKYGDGNYSGYGHTHSGLLDLTIATGLPGTTLWLLFLALVLRHAWRQARHQRDPTGLLIILLVLGFFSRSLIDSNLRDHMLAEFMLLLGIYLGFGGKSATVKP